MDTAIVPFTRDLRVHDNPALANACARARQMVPLFVVDPALAVPPNRAKFLADSVAVLREELRVRGGGLVIRQGDPVTETIRLATTCAATSPNWQASAPYIHTPWKLPAPHRRQLKYPGPLLDMARHERVGKIASVAPRHA